MSSSRYGRGYDDDLKLPPIREPTSRQFPNPNYRRESLRILFSSFFFLLLFADPTMEPPAHPQGYSRSPPMTLPPLVHPERSRSSMGHNSQYYQPTSPISSRHPDPRPSSSSYRPSHRSSSTAEQDFHPYTPQQPIPSSHRPSSFGAPESGSPPSTRAYSCDICGASFSRAYDCKRHRDIHTRQGGHECPYCKKTLSRADALKRHMERGCAWKDEDEDEEPTRKDRRHSMGGDTHKYYPPTTTSRR